MRFHYALVDDLISQAEFDERVEAKADECGGLVDEPTAAMLVVGDLGRAHRKIRDLFGRASLVCFFGRVLAVSPPRAFVRADGEEGRVATLSLGDETGRVDAALFDEKADAAGEIEVGEVLEVIARPSARRRDEVITLALQKSGCEVDCPVPLSGNDPDPVDHGVDLTARVLHVRPPRTFTRRDGSPGAMSEALIGNGEGVFRLVAWHPDLIQHIDPGDVVRVTGARFTERSGRREYSVDEGSAVEVTGGECEVWTTPIAQLPGEGTVSVRGSVAALQPPRQFVARSGAPSWVRNVVIADESGQGPLVLWGEHALLPLGLGDRLEVYGGTVKPGRYGDLEISAGWSAAIVLPAPDEVELAVEGTVLATPAGLFIDDGTNRYQIPAGEYGMGDEVRIEGRLLGNRLVPETVAPAAPGLEDVRRRLASLAPQKSPE